MEFFLEAKRAGVKPLIGAELRIEGQPLCLYVQNSTGYHNLCRLLSTPKMKLDGLTEGLLAVGPDQHHAHHFPSRFYRGVSNSEELKKGSGDQPVVLHQPVHYAVAAERWKFDVVQSIRTLTLLKQEHPDKRLNGEFHFRSPQKV